ncbi:MAG: chain-length determining protein, partial [Tannerellaceae bacterium]|nr:chain-length determining protein [Tannerellaceae bacterium]
LYPDVVRSIPFLLELFPLQVTDSRKELTTTFYEYMFEYQKSAWWNYIIKAPFQLLGWARGLVTDESETNTGESDNIIRLTEEQRRVIESLQSRISVSVDKKTFVITASVEMQDPVISAQIAKIIVECLQNYITNYRTQKAKQDYDFTEKAYTDAKETYYKSQESYAKFEDSNKNIISATYRTEQIRLQNEMSLAFGVYNTLAQQLEQNKLRIQEQTPVYTVIEPATVPLKASSPRKLLILVGFIFLAFCGAAGYLLLKDAFVKK